MKKKLLDLSATFSRAIVQPVMFLSVTGLVLTLGVVLKMDSMPDVIKPIGEFVYNLMMNGGINQLSVIFCVGITAALAKRKKVDAAILGISIYLLFLYANNAWLTTQGLLVDSPVLIGSGQAMVLGVQVVDMGVFLGILLGCLTGWIFNKFSEVEFPDVVRVYGGSRLAYFLSGVMAVALAIVLCYVWPEVNNGIMATAKFIDEAGSFGLFIYGFLNRFLIPTGMHHLVYMPFVFTPMGGMVEIGGEVAVGAQQILMLQLGNLDQVAAMDPSIRYLMFGFSKVFGTVGIALAFIKTAKPSQRQKFTALVLPMLFVAVVAGITEPFEFLFLFISPLLWLVHSILDGLFQVIIFALGARFPLYSGVLNASTFMISMPGHLSKWFITAGVGVIGTGVWYAIFVFLIEKLNLKTPGREDEDESEIQAVSQTTTKLEEFGDIQDIIDGLGGKENIELVTNCFTRLRVEVKDINLVNQETIQKFNPKGIVVKGNNIQIIIGMKVQTVREDVCQILGME